MAAKAIREMMVEECEFGGSRGGKNRVLTLEKLDCCERRGEGDDHISASEKK